MADDFFPWAQGGPYEAARRRDSASAARIVCSSPAMSKWCSETIFKVVYLGNSGLGISEIFVPPRVNMFPS